MTLFWIQLLIVMICIAIGGRFGGIGLGAAGGIGMTILVLLFGLQPASPPINVLLIIISVIACVSVLQAAGGLDRLVRIAEKALRKKPSAIIFLGPLICSIFTIFCGTAYVAFSIYPVIAEVSAEAKIRPERPLSISVIASGIAVVASPMSAATAGMIGALAIAGVTPLSILSISIPACLMGGLFGCLSVIKKGKELEDDPQFQRKIANGEYAFLNNDSEQMTIKSPEQSSKKSLYIFALGVFSVVFLGSATYLLPSWEANAQISRLSTPELIQMLMLSAAFLIMVICKVPSNTLASGSVFRSGLIGVVGVFGASWMTGTFFEAYKPLFMALFSDMVQTTPMLFGLVLFCFSAVIFSPAATVAALMPLGASLGIHPALLIALLPACCGDFIVPGAGQIGCVAFDRTGTTKIGKYVINHSYLRPGVVYIITAVLSGYTIANFIM